MVCSGIEYAGLVAEEAGPGVQVTGPEAVEGCSGGDDDGPGTVEKEREAAGTCVCPLVSTNWGIRCLAILMQRLPRSKNTLASWSHAVMARELKSSSPSGSSLPCTDVN